MTRSTATTAVESAATGERHVVFCLPLEKSLELQAYLQTYKGRRLAHLRFVYTTKDGEERPAAGVSVEIDRVHELLTATEMLVAAVNEETANGA